MAGVIAEAAGVAIAHRDKDGERPVVFDYSRSEQVKAAMEQAAADGFATDKPVEEIKADIVAARDETKG